MQAIIHEETSFVLSQLPKKYFESGEQAGKMLALRLKQIENQHFIPAIYDCKGSLVCEQKQINAAFQEFYSNLYKSEYLANNEDMDNFLKDISLPTLKIKEKETLETCVLETEVKSAIKALSNGKTPGSDGFSIEFYKSFQDILAPFLTMLFNDIIFKQSMPMTMRSAIISLIPKQGKDHMQMSNYRPLSLLNNDYKLFTKILAMRLEKVIPSLVHLDQVGFIRGRLSSNNMRRLLHVMARASTFQHPAVAISLDAEKAFDRIEWPFLFHVFSKFGFGPKCIQWIKALYFEPTACVKTNGVISHPFQLFRSTRQGCPVSPLIFILALEPLACAIRANQNITGINLSGYDFKASLYADDILLTLSHPLQSIPHLLKLVEKFGQFTGYKINCSKSEAIPLNHHTFATHLGSAPFVWKPQGMKYLGINIISPINKIFDLNGPNILKGIREDLKRWTVLPLSLWGRVEIIKMNILPRLSFVISAIPLKFPQQWFKEIDKILSSFLWCDKKPRINHKKLSMPRNKGGLAVPDVYLYYLAYNVRFPLSWAYKNKNQYIEGSWEWLEERTISECNKSISISSLWYHPKYNDKIDNSLIDFSCEIVKAVHKQMLIDGSSLPSCPIWNNPLLTAGGRTLTDNTWQQHNITQVGQVVRDGDIIPFKEIKIQFGLNDSAYFQYFQLKSIFKNFKFKGIKMGSNIVLDSKLRAACTGRGTVSVIYKLLSSSLPDSTTVIKSQWERDIGSSLTADQWDLILKQSTSICSCVRYKIIQFKIIHRAYITPHKLKKMDPNVSELCWHGCGELGTFMHLLWFCPVIEQFWSEVIDILKAILNIHIPKCPVVCLLGSAVGNIHVKIMQRIIALAFLSVKRTILMNWKIRKPDCYNKYNWLKDFLDLLSMEKATSILKDNENEQFAPWTAIREHLRIIE